MDSSNFINHERASEFVNRVQDPVIRGLLKYSYQMILLVNATPQEKFDLLYFCQVMELFLRDRDGLSRALHGDYGEDKTGIGE